MDKVWIAPAARMKAHREHRVPLSPRAVVILEQMRAARQADDGNSYVFPGPKPGTRLSNMALLMLLRRMGVKDLTVHGFRATFKTWTSERTSFQNEIAEAALAHIIGDKVEQAYRRGDFRQTPPAYAAMGKLLHHSAGKRARRQGHSASRKGVGV